MTEIEIIETPVMKPEVRIDETTKRKILEKIGRNHK